VTNFHQDWGRFEIRGQSCRLQVLDPVTTFEIEPELVAHFGNTLLMSVAAPDNVISALGGSASQAHGIDGSLVEAMRDRDRGTDVAATGLRLLSQVLQSAILNTDLDADWLVQTFEAVVFDRLKIGGSLVECWTDWQRAGMRPADKWLVLAAQLRQTYRPLWTRSPYDVRLKEVKDYGVKAPNSPKAEQWAYALAKAGVASPNEILRHWSPERLIQQVELQAMEAARHERAEEARATASKGKR
jgi:hypothetical protein